MRRGILVTGAVLCLGASSAFAGLDLTWNACNTGPGHASEIVFSCQDLNNAAYLFGCFQRPVQMPHFYALDVAGICAPTHRRLGVVEPLPLGRALGRGSSSRLTHPTDRCCLRALGVPIGMHFTLPKGTHLI